MTFISYPGRMNRGATRIHRSCLTSCSKIINPDVDKKSRHSIIGISATNLSYFQSTESCKKASIPLSFNAGITVSATCECVRLASHKPIP